MNYRRILIILFAIGISSCTSTDEKKISNDIFYTKAFANKGFTLVYDDKLFKNKKVSKKMEKRSLVIFQKNLKKGTTVKVTNILNRKTIIASVGSTSLYPIFNNSVISKRIAKELDIDINEPYIEILEINENSAFVAKKAKTFDEEKNVANKAPIELISINNLNKNTNEKNLKQNLKRSFNYSIKIADFYFKKTAISMVNRIKDETSIDEVSIKELSPTQYRVILGSFSNINSLQNAFNDINILKFENIEIIKNN